MLKKNFLPTQHVRADVVPETLDEKGRTIEVVWTTGAKVKRSPWFGEPYFEELSLKQENIRMDFLNSGKAPFLAVHRQGDLEDVIGIVEKAWLTPTDGRALVRFSESEDVEKIWLKVKEGILRGISVGYMVHRYERMPMAEGEEVPTYLAVDWEPKEISLVPIGADAGAGVRSDNDRGCQCEVVIKNVAQRGEEETEMSVKVKEDQNPAPVSVDVEAEKRGAAAEERKRIAEIRKAAKIAKLDDAFAEKLVNDGVDLDKARSLIVDEWAKRGETEGQTRTQVRVESGGQDEVETRRAGIENALLHRAFPEQHKLVEQGREFRGMSLVRMAEECLGRAGRGMGVGELVSRALTTTDFPLILESMGGKMLMTPYQIQARQWEKVAARGTLRDYKPTKRYQVGDTPALLEVKEGGEYQAGAFGEKAESVQLVDYGRLIKFTRQMIINDDLQAFQRVIGGFGGASARKIESLVFGILDGNPVMADGVALFHGTHGNLGVAAAIAEASLSALEKLFLDQKTLDGEDFMNIMPRYLFCGTAKKLEGQKILAAITAGKSGDVNPYQGAYELLVNPRISGNKWGLLADPTVIPTIEVSFLDGESGPVVDSKEEFDSDGVSFKCRQTASVKAIEHKGAARNPGN